MKIIFERDGGFAGIRFSTILNTDNMTVDEANALQEMVRAADFFNLPATMTMPKAYPDSFQYTLEIEDADRKHTLKTTDMALINASDALKRLISYLTTVAKQSGRDQRGDV